MIERQIARPLAPPAIGRTVGTRRIGRRRSASALVRPILKRFAASAPRELSPFALAGVVLLNIPLVGALTLRHAICSRDSQAA